MSARSKTRIESGAPLAAVGPVLALGVGVADIDRTLLTTSRSGRAPGSDRGAGGLGSDARPAR